MNSLIKKDKQQKGRKCLQNAYLVKDLYLEYIKEFYTLVMNKQSYQQMANYLNRHFTKEDIRITDKHVKRILKHH